MSTLIEQNISSLLYSLKQNFIYVGCYAVLYDNVKNKIAYYKLTEYFYDFVVNMIIFINIL
jgi:hypothetical protein